jgi:hypothetical protein
MDYDREREVNSSNSYEEPHFDSRPGHKIVLIGITIILILLAIIFFILFYNPATTQEMITNPEPAEQQPTNYSAFDKGPLKATYKEPEPLFEERPIKIKNLKLCKVLANKMCTELEGNIYSPGKQIQLYFEVTNSSVRTVGNSNAIAFEGDFKIFDEFHYEIEAARALNFYTYVNTGSKGYLKQKHAKFQTFVPSDELDPPGYYTAEITIRDIYSDTEDVKTIDFWLK